MEPSTSLELDEQTRDSVLTTVKSIQSHKSAYNVLVRYHASDRIVELCYSLCFMPSDLRINVLQLMSENSKWNKPLEKIFKMLGELQEGRAEYDRRIRPFVTTTTKWKCPFEGCKGGKLWEEVRQSCSECPDSGFHLSCDQIYATKRNEDELESTKKSTKRNHNNDDPLNDGNIRKRPREKKGSLFQRSRSYSTSSEEESDLKVTSKGNGDKLFAPRSYSTSSEEESDPEVTKKRMRDDDEVFSHEPSKKSKILFYDPSKKRRHDDDDIFHHKNPTKRPKIRSKDEGGPEVTRKRKHEQDHDGNPYATPPREEPGSEPGRQTWAPKRHRHSRPE